MANGECPANFTEPKWTYFQVMTNDNESFTENKGVKEVEAETCNTWMSTKNTPSENVHVKK